MLTTSYITRLTMLMTINMMSNLSTSMSTRSSNRLTILSHKIGLIPQKNLNQNPGTCSMTLTMAMMTRSATGVTHTTVTTIWS